ncbi:hypothetical protein T261_8442 [Streptomyces lydicus]|nr:hypothetical protein T261_8442 [Streptomyces lydicus]
MFPDDQQFWFATLRNLCLAVYGGSDVGEVVATASRVTPDAHDAGLDIDFTGLGDDEVAA